jgi:predicted acetyltransferase
MSFSIRPPLDRDEALRFFRLACPALLAPVSAAEGWLEREGHAHARLAFEGHSLLGGLMVQRMWQWFGGKAVPSGAVRGVVVAPAHRDRAVALRLMRHSLEELRASGVPLAMLFPATQKLYRKTGFEQAGSYEVVSLPLHELGTPRAELDVHTVMPTDPVLMALHEGGAAQAQGLFRRNKWLWRRVTEPTTPLDLEAYVFGAPESPEGYVLLHAERGTDPHFGTLVVRDRALLTARAIRTAKALFARYRSTMDRVRLPSAPVDGFLVGLDNQQRVVTERRDRWMLRLVDVGAALAARGYPPVDAEVHLLVRDDFLEPAEERLVLRVRGGKGTVEPGGSGSVDVDVRGLSGMYTGYLAAKDAAELGYLRTPVGEARGLDALFAGPAPYVTDHV